MELINRKIILRNLLTSKYCRKRNHKLKESSTFCKKCKKYDIRYKSKYGKYIDMKD